MSDTPETDARIGIISNGSNVVDAGWARQLERERNSAIQSAKGLAVNFRSSEVKRIEVEAELNEAREKLETTKEHLYSTNAACNKLEAERDQLRKVADELMHATSFHASLSDIVKARESYNSLPHVIGDKHNG